MRRGSVLVRSAITVSAEIMVCPSATKGSTPSGQVHIHTRAEANHPETLARLHLLAFLHFAQYAPRHETGDLHHGNLAPIGQFHRQTVAFIIDRRFVQRRIQELAGAVGDLW